MSNHVSVSAVQRGSSKQRFAIIAIKVAVTAGCLWYVAWKVDFSKIAEGANAISIGWIIAAVLIAVLQIPLVALRRSKILDSLTSGGERIPRFAMVAVTAIGAFFWQILPGIVGDGICVWLLLRLGSGWRNAVMCVMIDGGICFVLLLALAFGIWVLPSALTAAGGYRDVILIVCGAQLLMAGALGLVLVPQIAAILPRWRFSSEIIALAEAYRRVLIGRGSPAILTNAFLGYALTIVLIWCLGRAQGIILTMPDAAVLFTVMVGVLFIPISIGGWGLRELAVVALLGDYGVAPERALLFSVCFGLVWVVGSLPGAFAWLLYPLPRARLSGPRDLRII